VFRLPETALLRTVRMFIADRLPSGIACFLFNTLTQRYKTILTKNNLSNLFGFQPESLKNADFEEVFAGIETVSRGELFLCE